MPSLLVAQRTKKKIRTKRKTKTTRTRELLISNTIRTKANMAIMVANIRKELVTAMCATVLHIKHAIVPIDRLLRLLTVPMATRLIIWILQQQLTMAMLILATDTIRACKVIKTITVDVGARAVLEVAVAVPEAALAVHAVAALEEVLVVLEAEDVVVTDAVEVLHVIEARSESAALHERTSVMISQSVHVQMTKTAKTTRVQETTRARRMTKIAKMIRLKTTKSVLAAEIKIRRLMPSKVPLKR